MQTEYKGIDYGRGLTNIDTNNGIRYGVIAANDVGQAWFDESEANYYYVCPYCDHDIGFELQEVCPKCKKEYDAWDFEWDEPNPISVYGSI